MADMTDIVERLRRVYTTHPIVTEAADEIEWLQELLWQEAGNRVEIERLRAALRAILDDPEIGTNVALYAKTALAGDTTG